jgi:hypothetical protein
MVSSMPMILLPLTLGLASNLPLLHLLAVTVRRRQTLGRAFFWAGFFPLGSGWVTTAVWRLAYQQDPFRAIESAFTRAKLGVGPLSIILDLFSSLPALLHLASGLGAIPVLVWLLLAADPEASTSGKIVSVTRAA